VPKYIFIFLLILIASPLQAGSEPVEANQFDDAHLELNKFLATVLGESKEIRHDRAKKALEIAELALEEPPQSHANRLLQVASLGSLARTLGPGASVSGRYGSRSKKAIEQLIELAPNDPVSKALAGVWNLEVIRRGGGPGAFLLGASSKEGIQLLEEAYSDAPENTVILFSYGVAILSLSPSKNHEKSSQLLSEAKKHAEQNDDELSKKIIAQSEQILKLLEIGFVDEAGNFAVESM